MRLVESFMPASRTDEELLFCAGGSDGGGAGGRL